GRRARVGTAAAGAAVELAPGRRARPGDHEPEARRGADGDGAVVLPVLERVVAARGGEQGVPVGADGGARRHVELDGPAGDGAGTAVGDGVLALVAGAPVRVLAERGGGAGGLRDA